MSFINVVGKQANLVVLSIMAETPAGDYEVSSVVVAPTTSRLAGMTTRGYTIAMHAVQLKELFGGGGSILQVVTAAIGAANAYVATRSFGKVPAAAVEAIDGRIDPLRAKPYLEPANASGQQILSSSPAYAAGIGQGIQLASPVGIAGMSFTTIALIGLVAWLVLKK